MGQSNNWRVNVAVMICAGADFRRKSGIAAAATMQRQTKEKCPPIGMVRWRGVIVHVCLRFEADADAPVLLRTITSSPVDGSYIWASRSVIADNGSAAVQDVPARRSDVRLTYEFHHCSCTMTRLFEGTGTALSTPFKSDGSIDFVSFDRLLEEQIDGGIEALVVCGTTGESATLTFEEKLELIGRTVKRAGEAGENRPQVIAGTGSNVTADTVNFTMEAAALGVDGALLVSPYYNKPSQRGLYEHFSAVAAVVPQLPLILYNVPGRTSGNISAATTLRLANDHENIMAIKEASADMEQCCEIIRHAPQGFLLYSGEDSLTLPLLSMGARGVIAVVSNEVPRQFGDMVRKGLAGDFSGARDLHMALFELMRLNFIESNPVPVKAALHMMGVFDRCVYRSPLVPLAEENAEKLRNELLTLGLIEQVESPAEV